MNAQGRRQLRREDESFTRRLKELVGSATLEQKRFTDRMLEFLELIRIDKSNLARMYRCGTTPERIARSIIELERLKDTLRNIESQGSQDERAYFCRYSQYKEIIESNKERHSFCQLRTQTHERNSMSESTKNLIEFLKRRGTHIIFSGDERPVFGQSPLMEEFMKQGDKRFIVFLGEGESKGEEIFNNIGVNQQFLDDCGRFVVESLQKGTEPDFSKKYNKLNKKGGNAYPPLSTFFVYVPATPDDKPSILETHLRSFLGCEVSVSELLPTIPGIHELKISNETLKKELEHLTQVHRKYLLQHGIEKFMADYPNVFCSGNRPVWRPATTTAWGIGNVVKVFLGLKFSSENLKVIKHHLTVPVCSCGLSTSNIGGFFEHLFANNEILVLSLAGKRMEITPTPKQYKSKMAFVCDCKKHITWCSLSTKYFQTFSGQGKAFHKSFYKKLLKKVSEYYALKQCVICLDDEVLYENQRIDGCGVKHADCICFVCYSKKLKEQHRVNGKLVFSHLYQCVICHTFHDTPMGRYLQTVPDTHQTRWCNDCGSLFHDKPPCGDQSEIPIDCPSCFDKKEKQREFVECPNPECQVMNNRIAGCDFAVCGRDYDGSYLYDEYDNRIDAGCGKPFCYGCSQPFKQDVLVDYKCPCYIEGTYPEQYNLANKQACQDKYYLLEWKYYIRDTILTIRQLGDRIQCNLRQTGDIQNQHHQHHIINSDNVHQIVIRGDVEQTVIINDVENSDSENMREFFSIFDDDVDVENSDSENMREFFSIFDN
jgi:hypothetical protein